LCRLSVIVGISNGVILIFNSSFQIFGGIGPLYGATREGVRLGLLGVNQAFRGLNVDVVRPPRGA